MPQPAQNSLIHILLLWTTMLSIIQAVFIILFFTAGQRGPNSALVASGNKVRHEADETPSMSPSEPLGKYQMLTYKATEVDGNLTWEAIRHSNLVSYKGQDLKIMEDGLYWLSLQVELLKRLCPGLRGPKYNINVTCGTEVLLQGWINTDTCSTGLLGRVVMLSSGDTLKFNNSLPRNGINEKEYLTHLDIIYMP